MFDLSCKKRKKSTPYSKDYMKEKWGVNVQDYAQKEGLTKKPTRKKSPENVKSSGFSFFYSIFIISIILLSFVGVLKLTESTIVTQFPSLEPYIGYFFDVLNILIDHFFETLDNFKILISDFFR